MTPYQVILGGSYITKKGNLVLRKQVPLDIEFVFGQKVKEGCGHLGKYFFLTNEKVAILQVHRHYRDDLDIVLTCQSLNRLKTYAMSRPHYDFKLEVPNHTQLNIALNILPKNIIVTKRKNEAIYRYIRT